MSTLKKIGVIFLLLLHLISSAYAQTYKLDDEGDEVRHIQQALSRLGIYYAQVTGHYGPKTASSVRTFQRRYGLRQTGEADEATLAALYNAVGSTKTTASSPQNTNASQIREATPGSAEAKTPSTSNAYSYSGTLRLGSDGDAVKQLQSDLKDLGYYKGTITGHFGSMTQTSVRSFQRANRLKTDGIAGPATLSKIRELRTGEKTPSVNTPAVSAAASPVPADYQLNGYLTVGVTLRKGSSSGYVKRLQNALGKLGYFKGTATGYYGAETESAVRSFQSVSGLTVDGIAGRRTLMEINKQL